MDVAENVSLIISDSFATLSLGTLDESVVTLSLQRMESLQAALDSLEAATGRGQLRGVVLRGATAKMFCAGADLKLLRLMQAGDIANIKALMGATRLSEEQRMQLENLNEEGLGELGEQLSLIGRHIFQRLQSLQVTTVAAIGGSCLGGGLELALHCDYLVAADSDSIFGDGVKTEIGFPEPMLGLLEGWGGIELTVRRLGLRRALPFLMQGKSITPRHAQKLGIIDAVVPADQLHDYAADVARGHIKLRRHRMSLVDRFLTFTALGRAIVQRGAKNVLADFPPEHYPAPHAILEVAMQGLKAGQPEGATLASQRFGQLMMSPQARALVHVLFGGTEASKARAKATARPTKRLKCLVIGAGQMGAGIAHALARSGQTVLVQDPYDTARDAARSRIAEWIGQDRKLTETDKNQILGNVSFHDEPPDNLEDVDFVIEAVVEDEAVKKDTLSRLSPRLRPDTFIATNTSSIPISRLAAAVSAPANFFGMHYFNPVRRMRLVEIIRGEQTSDAAAALGAALAVAQGKYPIVVQDVPGFLVNRMLFPYLNEALRLVLEGFSIESIDGVAEQFGMFMGPLKTLDLVGFDVGRQVAGVLSAAYPQRMQTPKLAAIDGGDVPWEALVDALARRDVIGKKTGRGFYVYGNRRGKPAKPTPNPQFADDNFWTELGVRPLTPQPPQPDVIRNRLIFSLVNEAVRCLDEGVAGTPGAEAALQIDLASVLGFGFAPFRGGVIHYAESIGARTIHKKLQQLAEQSGEPFRPWIGIQQRAEWNLPFHQALCRDA